MPKKRQMSFEKYTGIKAVNFSTLKHVETSLLHYKHAIEQPHESTDAQIMGDAIHAACLEPARFLDEFVCFRGDRRKKTEWESFQEQHQDKDILRADDYDACVKLRDRFRSSPLVKPYLVNGKCEQTITWVDPETGLECKARLDWVCPSTLADLKSAIDIKSRGFGNAAAKYHYHVQAAWYRWGYKIATGTVLPFKFFAAEKSEPFDIAVYSVTDEALMVGEETFRRWLGLVAWARKENKWPGVQLIEQDLELPQYIYGSQNLEPLEDIA